MPVKTINLEASVEWVKSNMRPLLADSTDLFERLDEVVALSQVSADEACVAGRAVYKRLADYADAAEAGGDVGSAETIGCVASTFSNDLRIWYNEAKRNPCRVSINFLNGSIGGGCSGCNAADVAEALLAIVAKLQVSDVTPDYVAYTAKGVCTEFAHEEVGNDHAS